MQISLHKNARTTPAVRAEIAASSESPVCWTFGVLRGIQAYSCLRQFFLPLRQNICRKSNIATQLAS